MNPGPVDPRHLPADTFVARVEHHAILDSTNDRAKQCAAGGPGPLPLLIVADEQTAGRGRGANRWWTGRGGLAFSLLLDHRGVHTDFGPGPLVSLCAAAAVAEAVIPLLPGRPVGIHWPNDVFAAGGKLAGVLVEVLTHGLCVVGIGVNLNNTMVEAPAELRQTATTLRDVTAKYHDPTLMLTSILRHFAGHVDQLRVAPAEVARLADRLCLQHGRTLCVESAGGEIRGRCAGIAPDGALLLDTPGGRQRIVTGTLHRLEQP